MYKTGGGTFCPKTTAVDEKIVALLTPQFQPLPNEFDSSAPYYHLGKSKTFLFYHKTPVTLILKLGKVINSLDQALIFYNYS